jgi:putative membrane protein insertion efficiency factor
VTQVLAMPLVWMIRLYQLILSPMLAQQCRFYPSCSAYAVTALTRFGVLKGSWLTVRRLARCHPWNPGGVDHVPPRTARRPTPTTSDTDHRLRPSGTAP